MPKLFLISCLIAAAVCCEKRSFDNVKVETSKYLSLKHQTEIAADEVLTGCIAPDQVPKDVLKVVVKNEDVPVLHPGAVADLEWLHELVLSHDGIEEVKPGAFKNLPTISSIDLSHNRIKEIKGGVFNGLAVRRLLLSDNDISSIAPKAFDNMPNLYRLDLDHNQLGEWKGLWLGSTPSLKIISASFNHISQLPARAFASLSGGETASISLSHNEIAKVDRKAFEGVEELEYLHLDSNAIADVEALAGLKTVKHVLLNNNKITCVPEDALEALPESEVVNLNGNPLDCQCLKEMKKWAQAKHVNINMNIRSIECMQERIRNVLDSVKQRK